MDSKCKYFGIITARAGSKGVPHKNMQIIGTKPMIQYTFEAALGAEKLEYFILSTNDQQVIELAGKFNIPVPFIRSELLSTDNTPTKDVLNHSLEWYKNEYNHYPENIFLLQPTSPFRTAVDIDNAITTYEKSNKESLISACLVSQHPSDCFTINPDTTLNFINIEKTNTTIGRQSYKKAYFIDGAIYISKTKRFIEQQTLFDQHSAIHVLPKSHSIDIDDYYDLYIARAVKFYSENTEENIFNY